MVMEKVITFPEKCQASTYGNPSYYPIFVGKSRQISRKISFGDIPNSNSLMPCLTTWAHSCSAAVLPMRTMSSPKGVQKQSHACSGQSCQATNHTPRNPPEPSGSCIRNLHQHTSEASRTFRNLPPEPSGTCLRNLHQHTPEPSGTFRNLPPEPASGTYTSTHRNPSEPSGTFLRNLLLRPAPAHTGSYLG